MKLLVLSDLHVDCAPFVPQPSAVQAADVVALAGDIDDAPVAIEWIAQTFAGKPVVYVAGNHGFYGGHWDETLRILRGEAQRYGVHFLEDDEVVAGDVRFLGCTLWTDFSVLGGGDRQFRAMHNYRKGMNDCRRISAGIGHDCVAPTARRLTPKEVLRRHMASRAWLSNQLAMPWPGKTVVVTHHLPSLRSVAERHRHDWLTPGYASQLPEDMLCAADLWIHGHTHDSSDYEVTGPAGSVRVVCNPRGYPASGGAESRSFRPDLLIEI